MYPTNAVEDFFIVCAHSVIDGFRYPKPNIFGTPINQQWKMHYENCPKPEDNQRFWELEPEKWYPNPTFAIQTHHYEGSFITLKSELWYKYYQLVITIYDVEVAQLVKHLSLYIFVVRTPPQARFLFLFL